MTYTGEQLHRWLGEQQRRGQNEVAHEAGIQFNFQRSCPTASG